MSEQLQRKAPHCVSQELAPHAWLGTNAWSLVNQHCPVLRIPAPAKGQPLAADAPEEPKKTY